MRELPIGGFFLFKLFCVRDGSGNPFFALAKKDCSVQPDGGSSEFVLPPARPPIDN